MAETLERIERDLEKHVDRCAEINLQVLSELKSMNGKLDTIDNSINEMSRDIKELSVAGTQDHSGLDVQLERLNNRLDNLERAQDDRTEVKKVIRDRVIMVVITAFLTAMFASSHIFDWFK